MIHQQIENSNCTNPSIFLEKKGKVVSVTGGCVPGAKKEEELDCTTFHNPEKTICTCNKHLCNGVDLGTTTTTQKTTTTTQKTNGIKRLEVAILETFVLIIFVSFVFY